MPSTKKQSVITFKADGDMLEALERIPNKSEFIRAAIMAALDESCPFCGGTGTLNPHQRMHWTSFLKAHTLIHCKECNGYTIDCGSGCPAHASDHFHHDNESQGDH